MRVMPQSRIRLRYIYIFINYSIDHSPRALLLRAARDVITWQMLRLDPQPVITITSLQIIL